MNRAYTRLRLFSLLVRGAGGHWSLVDGRWEPMRARPRLDQRPGSPDYRLPVLVHTYSTTNTAVVCRDYIECSRILVFE